MKKMLLSIAILVWPWVLCAQVLGCVGMVGFAMAVSSAAELLRRRATEPSSACDAKGGPLAKGDRKGSDLPVCVVVRPEEVGARVRACASTLEGCARVCVRSCLGLESEEVHVHLLWGRRERVRVRVFVSSGGGGAYMRACVCVCARSAYGRGADHPLYRGMASTTQSMPRGRPLFAHAAPRRPLLAHAGPRAALVCACSPTGSPCLRMQLCRQLLFAHAAPQAALVCACSPAGSPCLRMQPCRQLLFAHAAPQAALVCACSPMGSPCLRMQPRRQPLFAHAAPQAALVCACSPAGGPCLRMQPRVRPGKAVLVSNAPVHVGPRMSACACLSMHLHACTCV